MNETPKAISQMSWAYRQVLCTLVALTLVSICASRHGDRYLPMVTVMLMGILLAMHGLGHAILLAMHGLGHAILLTMHGLCHAILLAMHGLGHAIAWM